MACGTFRALSLTAVWWCALQLPGCGGEEHRAAPNTNGEQQHSDANDDAARGQPFVHADWRPAPDPTKLVTHGLEFDKPATWIETPPVTSPRSMNYSVPGRHGEDAAELAVFFFTTDESIAVEQFVERWRQMFAADDLGLRPEPVLQTQTIHDMPVTLVQLTGSYMRPGSGWYSTGQMMQAALVQTPGGTLLLRLTGPVATVQSGVAQFETMVRSLRPAAANSADFRD